MTSTGEGLGGAEDGKGGALLGVVKEEMSSPQVRGATERRPEREGLCDVLVSMLICRIGSTERGEMYKKLKE